MIRSADRATAGLAAARPGTTEPGTSEPAGWPVLAADAAAAFTAAVEAEELNLPLPGCGRTAERFAALARLAGEDLSVARLAEGHADALAVLAELGFPPPPRGSRWGVWAAQPPGPSLIADRAGRTWRLSGTKQYCSGARACTDALVTAKATDGDRLFAVSTAGLEPVPGTWPATGMAGSDTLDVRFSGIPAEPVGGPGSYTGRPVSRMAASESPRAGTAEPAPWAGRCCSPLPPATSARMRWRTSEPSTSPLPQPAVLSPARLPRSTPTRPTAAVRRSCAACGFARSSRRPRARSWNGSAGHSGRARCVTTADTPAASPT